ncbi:type II toxin-antitoxin system RelE/ParE family toxin [Pseudomonas gingeri]|uniref:Type II toxin-antitoxin system RelE/ParE family toxin n=1 Tax=Pseudomonas gingeri TaxID=117681 RepID=A0A7Y8C0U0_9PSED|nr:type II toxin-antitoxin system RelE/ParE family toxin [Pseudomonas gingeri]NWB94924.1 type II toxin-antitoxin system RelE/ParE family toxin [Pseudomonas gingeri]NWD67934.1 type II toxin-antitoxin system RelE/ParE family toxin [Pseudomonas gingeri]
MVTTDAFDDWLRRLRDPIAKARILSRLISAQFGALGDTRLIADGVSEMRIHTGPGYRVYFARQGEILILLLCAGDKSSQKRDIKHARLILSEIEQGDRT